MQLHKVPHQQWRHCHRHSSRCSALKVSAYKLSLGLNSLKFMPTEGRNMLEFLTLPLGLGQVLQQLCGIELEKINMIPIMIQVGIGLGHWASHPSLYDQNINGCWNKFTYGIKCMVGGGVEEVLGSIPRSMTAPKERTTNKSIHIGYLWKELITKNWSIGWDSFMIHWRT